MTAADIIARARRVYALPDGVPETNANAVGQVGSRSEHGRRLCCSVPWAVASAVLDAAHDGYVDESGNVSAIGPRWAVHLLILDLPPSIARAQRAYARARRPTGGES